MAASSQDDAFAGTPSELPLSQQTFLPSQLDIGPSQDDAAPPEAGDTLEELPLSPDAEEKLGDAVEAAEAAGRSESSLGEEADAPERGLLFGFPFGNPADPPMIDGRRRRGRPNRLLQEALQEAAARRGAHAESGALLLGAQPGAERTAVVGESALAEATQHDRRRLLREAGLGPEEQLRLLKRPISGLSPPSPLTGVLDACVQLRKLPKEAIDEPVRLAVVSLLEPGPLPTASKKVRAESLGLTTARLDVVLPMVGASIVVSDRGQRGDLEKAIARSRPASDLLLYADFCAYDETPLPIIVRDDSPAGAHSSPTQPQQQEGRARGADTFCNFGHGSVLTPMLSSSSSAQKVLQTVQGGGLLIKLGDRHVVLLSSTVCNLTVMSSGTAAITKEAQLQVSGVSRASTKFAQCMRIACTDRASANILAERELVLERGSSWSTLHTFCDIHRTASAHDKSFSLMPESVSGMIHCALAMRSGAALCRFRFCMRQEVESRFKVKHGRPSEAAKAYKVGVLRLFVSHGSRLGVRRLLLALCPNGDWRREEVEYYPPPGRPEQPVEVYMEHVTSGLITALLAAQPSIYPRHRWTGADLATDCLGVMEACHHLLSTSFARFVAWFEPASRARRVLADARDSTGQAMPTPHALQDDVAHLPRADDQRAEPEAMTAALVGEEQPSTAGIDQPAWAAINAAHRRLASAWLSGTPLVDLLLMRLVMEPLRQLMAHQFQVASEAWEVDQRARLAKAILRDGGASFADRSYRLSVAAEGDEEAKCLSQLGQLFEQSALWDLFPRSASSVGLRALAFRLLSRAACAVRQLLSFPHEQFPVRLFKLLAHPDLASELVVVPDCMLDAWSQELKRQHPTLRGADLEQKLFLVCMLGWRDISRVEAKHAAIRRQLKQASLQTRPQELRDLSALWCITQVRKRQERVAAYVGRVLGRKDSQAMSGAPHPLP